MNPTEPDTPLLRLLSIKQNPLVVEMDEEQLLALVKRLRHQPPKPTPAPKPDSKAARYQALLEAL